MKPTRRAWFIGSLGLLAVGFTGAANSQPEAAADPISSALHDEGGERFDYANGPMGLICWAAILEAMSEIGKRCEPDEDVAFREAMNGSLSRLEHHLRERGGWSEEQLARFRTQMGESDKPAALVCGNEDARLMYSGMSEAGAREIDRATDELISRSGPPEWGSCL